MDIKQYIFLTAGILGVVCILKLVFIKNNKEIYNNLFISLIAVLTIRQFNCLSGFVINQKAPVDDLSTTIFNLTLYIVLYLFLNNILNKIENKLRYLFPIIFIVVLYLTFNAILILNNNHNDLYKFIIDFTYTGSISFINFVMIKNYFNNENSNVNFKHFTANWGILIVLLFCLTPLKYLLQILSHLIDGAVIINYKYQLINSIICIIIFTYLLMTQRTLKEVEKESGNENDNNEIDQIIHLIWKNKIDTSKLNSSDKEVEKRIAMKIDFYINKVNTLDRETSVLLKKGTTINDLAMELKIPKSHLAFIFKYNCKISFVSFKNIIRIEKAKKLIKNGHLETHTLNSLAEKVGFKSYDPFFKSFKEITSTGPMEFSIIKKNEKK